jgi:hypothetical protein
MTSLGLQHRKDMNLSIGTIQHEFTFHLRFDSSILGHHRGHIIKFKTPKIVGDRCVTIVRVGVNPNLFISSRPVSLTFQIH